MVRHAFPVLLAAGLMCSGSAAIAKCKPGQVKPTKDCLNPPPPRGGGYHGGIFIPAPQDFMNRSQYLAAIGKSRDQLGLAKQQGKISDADFANGMKAVTDAPALANKHFSAGH